MPKIAYDVIKLGKKSLDRIEQANQIIAEYHGHNLDLTLRQLYYQFVSRGLIPNNDREYKKLGDIIANGRMVGLIDWDAIVDRTRYLRTLSHWNSPHEIISAVAQQYRIDKWARQKTYVEVWIEKDALIGVIEGVCVENDVAYLACRGYASASEIWRAGHQRFKPKVKAGKDCVVIYLGDHDPSGIDMTRDIQDRLNVFTGKPGSVNVHRLALNMDQVEQYDPPPNPTKLTDSRASGYIELHGHECWELDALDPIVIRDLIFEQIETHRDQTLWDEAVSEEDQAKERIGLVADNWDDVVDRLENE